jgi:hypothetical protein
VAVGRKLADGMVTITCLVGLMPQCFDHPCHQVPVSLLIVHHQAMKRKNTPFGCRLVTRFSIFCQLQAGLGADSGRFSVHADLLLAAYTDVIRWTPEKRLVGYEYLFWGFKGIFS